MSRPIVIVGGGLAGQRCAETLRRGGCEEPIVMVCGEPHRPYDRPPLSKEVLLDADVEETLSFRSHEWYEQKAVRLLLGVTARRLNQRDRLIELSDGSSLPYARLLIATGARARRLAMFDGFENVSGLRTLEDARTLRNALVPGARLLVIGAGFIGQEAASSARKAGVLTTIVEAAASPLASVLGAELGDWFAGLHRSNGVELCLGEQVVAPRGEGRRVQAVTLAGGRTIACDHVLLGVGVQPDLDWLEGSTLQRTGVRTDLDGRTDVTDVYAAGDAAAIFDPQLDAHVLGSHWESAGRQGSRAARAMLGLDTGPASISSFWSDLYGTRLQYLGRASLADGVSFDGDPASRRFTATFTRDEEPVAVLLADRPEMLPQARALLTATTERTFA
jgi:3-phenylpropionate/trans-cinnamate dioxygenase ferredoxin reductase subunit